MAQIRRLAKLTRPRLHHAVARTRLYELLDKAGHAPAIWLAGPPGAGKTTVAAAYLEARQLTPLWYRLDRTDSDPSAFFHYLSESTAWVAPLAGRNLPLFGPEYQSDLLGFTHRYFRALFTYLPENVVLVVDDYHELPEQCDVHRILATAIGEIPDGHRMLIISRAAPPLELARHELSGSLERYDWEVLKLLPGEVQAIATSRGRSLDRAEAEALNARAQGWIAAVCLWLDRKSTATQAGNASPVSSGLEPLFRYLAAEVLARESPASQDVLLKTCLVPTFTAHDAQKLSDRAEAPEIVEELYRRQLFVERGMAGEAMYRYHDLFRSFLQNRLTERLGTGELARLACRSGKLLMSSGRFEEAFPLLVQGEDWDAAEAAYVQIAPAVVRQGRWRLLQQWSGSFPPEYAGRNPWLVYWQGRSVTLQDPAAAMSLLTLASERFEARGDRRGQALAIAGVLDALHFDVRAFDRIPGWLHRLADLARAGFSTMTAEDELPIHAAVMVSSSHLCIPGADLDLAVRRVTGLLDQCVDSNLVLSVSNMVHYYAGHCLDGDSMETAALAARSREGQPNLSADRLALYWLAEGHAHYTFCRFREALQCFDRADQVITDNGLRNRELVAGTWRCQCLAMVGDTAGARSVLVSLEPRVAALPGFVEALYLWAASVVEHESRHLDRSIELGMKAVALNRQSGSAISTVLWIPRLCVRLLESGRGSDAIAALSDPVLSETAIAYTRQRSGVALVQAWAQLQANQLDAAAETIQRALATSRDTGEHIRLRWFVPALAALASFAIERGIEPTTMAALVAAFGIFPPTSILQPWPWPVHIVTLGGFEVSLNGEPLTYGRKMPRRTLALLAAIVSAGGRQVPESRLSDDLWPDLDGDAAHEAFATALHRLRRLLGTNEAIVQSGRTVSLDCKRCFVDTWALDAAIQSAEGISRTLALYRGPFMPGDESPSSVAMRASLRSRVGRAVRDCVSVLEAGGDLSQAESVMAQALDADPAMFG